MIEIRHVCKTFLKRGTKGQSTEVDALKDFSLAVKANEFISLLGPSGCGKTTLLKMVGGLVPWDSGEIFVGGKPVTGPGPDRSMVFQRFALMPWADVTTNVAFGLEMHGVSAKESRKRALQQIGAVGLSGFESHYPHELSGGMQQRVGLARALLVDPDILLMDEPFGALDAQTRRLMQDDLLKIWQQKRKTAVFVTHSMEEAVYLSDRVVLMTPRPGQVKEIIDVPLPRPRFDEMEKEKEFVDLKEYLWAALKQMQAMPPTEGEHGG